MPTPLEVSLAYVMTDSEEMALLVLVNIHNQIIEIFTNFLQESTTVGMATVVVVSSNCDGCP